MNFLKALADNAKKRGLPVAEKGAQELWAALSETAMQYAADPATNPIAKAMIPGAVAVFDHVVRDAIDKIDGVQGDMSAD